MITEMGKNVKVHPSANIYGRNKVGANSFILENVYLGYPTTELLLKIGQEHLDFTHASFEGCILGENVIIRPDSVIYCGVRIGNNVRTGHRVMIREECEIKSNVLIGTNVVIERNVQIGSHVSIQSSVFIPNDTIIKDYVFVGPSVIMTNDKYPIRTKEECAGPVIEKGVSLGANCVIMPGVTVGLGSLVASNAVVTKDVPEWHLAVGSPARFTPLKHNLKKLNMIN